MNAEGNGSTLPHTTEYDFQYYALVLMVTALVVYDRKSGEILDDSALLEACKNGLITPYIAQNREELKKAIKKAKALLEGEEVDEEGAEVDEGEEADEEGAEVGEAEAVEKVIPMDFTRSQLAAIVNALEGTEGLVLKEVVKAIKKAIKKADK